MKACFVDARSHERELFFGGLALAVLAGFLEALFLIEVMA